MRWDTFAAIKWARSHKLTGTEQAILKELILCADKTGVAFPSHETIADYADVTTRTVRRAIKSLADRGLISIEERHRAVNRYTFNLDTLPDTVSSNLPDTESGNGGSLPDTVSSLPDTVSLLPDTNAVLPDTESGHLTNSSTKKNQKRAGAREGSLSFFSAFDLPPELEPGELAKDLDRLWRSEQKGLGLATYVPRIAETSALLTDIILGNEITQKPGDLTIAPLILPAAERYWREYAQVPEGKRPAPVSALTWVQRRGWEAYEDLETGPQDIPAPRLNVVHPDGRSKPFGAVAAALGRKAGIQAWDPDYYEKVEEMTREFVQREGLQLVDSGDAGRRW